MDNPFLPDKRPQGNSDYQIAQITAKNARYGLRLQFPGESSASGHYYKCNTAITFQVGQLVKVDKVAGTYIVAYPIGNPT